MKSFVIIFVLCFADGLLARIINKDETATLLKCAAENHLDILFLSASFYEKTFSVKNNEFKNEKDLNCSIACVYKHLGIISADGTLNITPTTQRLVANYTPEFSSKCSEEAKGDSCKLAGCLLKTHRIYSVFDETKTCFTEQGFDEGYAKYMWKKLFGLNDVEFSNALKDLLPSIKSKLNCSYACAMMKSGIISVTGEVLLLEEHSNILNMSLETINSCTQQAAGDICKLPGCLLKF